jgi:hypothetical protein
MSSHSNTPTIIATEYVEGTPILNADEIVYKSFINIIKFRINHNILYIKNHIEMLETELLQEQAKIRVLNEVLQEDQSDDEENWEDSENSENDFNNLDTE